MKPLPDRRCPSHRGRPRSRRSPAPRLERLEDRLSPAGLFDYSLLARTGAGWDKIEDFVGINDSREVGFIAADPLGQSAVFVAGPGAAEPRLVSFAPGPDRNYGRAVSISDGPDPAHRYVVARDQTTTPSAFVRKWAVDGNVDNRIVVATTSNIWIYPEPEYFTSFASFTDVNGHGEVAFIGLADALHKLRLRTSVGAADQEAFGVQVGDFSSTAGLRPQVSDTGEIVFRNPSAASLVMTEPWSDRFYRLAGRQEGFVADGDLPAIGRSPGVTEDGRVVVFFGNRPEMVNGQMLGPGIFASVREPGAAAGADRPPRRIVRLTGFPGELGTSSLGDPLSLTDYAVFSSVSGLATTDSRVAVAGSLSLAPESASVLHVSFLANNPAEGNREALWRLTLTVTIDRHGQMSFEAGRPEVVAQVGAALNPNVPRLAAPLADLEIYDPLNDRGDVAFWARTTAGDHQVVLAEAVRRPVVLIPGIVGTFPKLSAYYTWLLHRGVSPELMVEDPLTGVYNSFIRSLENAGYRRDVDLFVVNYDWRMNPGPTTADGQGMDGFIDGLSGTSITDGTYAYGVDYLGYWLKKAVEAWHARFPTLPLEDVDVIAHSTGGLVARTYLQSGAYGDTFSASFGTARLPKVHDFFMVGVPNRGGSKAWNVLHDNFITDVSLIALSKVFKGAYWKQLLGGPLTIRGDDYDISGVLNPRDFLELYIPTLQSLLATYDFLLPLGGSAAIDVNDLPEWRNNLLLDLNSGLDFLQPPVPDAFREANRFANVLTGRPYAVYGTNAGATLTYSEERRGPSSLHDIFPLLGSVLPIPATPGEVWYEDFWVGDNGDGTVPLVSSAEPFENDSRFTLLPFTQHVNTSGDVAHLALLSNRDVELAILRRLGQPVEPSDIVTDAGHLGMTLVTILLDPVDGFLIDEQGRRLGYSAETGPLAEIPGSDFFGGADGFGVIRVVNPAPLTLRLVGTGADFFVSAAGWGEASADGFEKSGTLAAGETLTVSLSFATTNRAPGIDPIANLSVDQGERTTFTVRATDADAGQALSYGLGTGAPAGATIDPATGLFAWQTGPDERPGVYPITVHVRDNGFPVRESVREFQVTVFERRPRVTAVTLRENPVAGGARFALDFSDVLDRATAEDRRSYDVRDSAGRPVTVAAASYTEVEGYGRVVLTMAGAAALPPDTYSVALDGLRLLGADGRPIGRVAHDLVVHVNGTNSLVLVGQAADGSLGPLGAPHFLGYDVPARLVADDFDRDGLPDLITVSTASRQLLLLRGVPGGGFAPAQPLALDFGDASLTEVQPLDWDRDGAPDLGVGGNTAGGGRLFLLVNDGHGGFRPAAESPLALEGPAMTAAAVGDFLGDGSVAFAVPGPYRAGQPGTVQIIGRQAGGSYGLVAEYPLPAEDRDLTPSRLYTGDFNGDGRPDLVTANGGYYLKDPGATLFLSTPTGLAAGVELVFEHTSSPEIVVGDHDGDGRTDFLFLHDYYRVSSEIFEGSVLTLMKGDGAGHFTEQPYRRLGRRALGLAGAADLNGDGRRDLVLTAGPYEDTRGVGLQGTPEMSSWSLLGDGRGGFTPATAGPVPLTVTGVALPGSVALIDLDRDGDLDAALGNQQIGQVGLLLNDGHGALRPGPAGPSVGSATPFQEYASSSTATGDFNGDGLADLVQVSAGLEVRLGEPDGGFRHRASLLVPAGAPRWVRVDDLDGDGRLDLVAGGWAVTVFLGEGDGRFTLHGPAARPGEGLSLGRGELADVTGDGHPDLVVSLFPLQGTNPAPAGYGVYVNDGSGGLAFDPFSPLPASFAGWASQAVCNRYDYDGDGRADLLASARDGLTVWHGNGDGTFSLGPVSPKAEENDDDVFLPADLDGDGRLDLLGYHSFRARDLHVYRGDGAGHFLLNPALTLHAPEEVRTAVVGSFNGDGAPDLALVSNNPYATLDRVALLLGRGDGRFLPPQEVTVGANPASLTLLSRPARVVAGTVLLAGPTHAPSAEDDAFDLRPGTVLDVPAGGVLANDHDPDGGPLRAELVDGPTAGSLTLRADGSFRYTPPPGFRGLATFRYRASDGALTSEPATVRLRVNAPPVFAPLAVPAAYVGIPIEFIVAATDSDAGDTLTYALESGAPAGLVLDPTTGRVLWSPTREQTGAHAFTVRVTDRGPAAWTVRQTVRVEVRPVPGPGVLDFTFGRGGQVQTSVGDNGWVRAMAVQPDGKILVAGNGGSPTWHFESGDALLARYLPDGTLDQTFGIGGVVRSPLGPISPLPFDYGRPIESHFAALALLPDGRILAGGYSGDESRGAQLLLARYLPNGALDTTFGQGGSVATQIAEGAILERLAVAPNGDIVVGADVYDEEETPEGWVGDWVLGLARYDAAGRLDPGFGNGGTLVTDLGVLDFSSFVGLAIQPDGKLIVAGGGDLASGTTSVPGTALARLSADGRLDATFGQNGVVVNATAERAYDMEQQADGKLVVLTFHGLLRYLPDGAPDTTFGRDGQVLEVLPNDVPFDLAVQPSGKLVVGGWAGTDNVLVARFRPDGSSDVGFGDQGRAVINFLGKDEWFRTLAVQADGKVLIGGSTVLWDGASGAARSQLGLARLGGDPEMRVTPTAGLVTVEPGQQATFTLALTGVPVDDVVIPLASSGPSLGTVSPAALILTPENALRPQTVTVTGGQLPANPVRYSVLTGPARSDDPRYDGWDAPDVTVTNVPSPVVPYRAGELQFAAAAVTVDETAGAVTVTVTRTGGSDGVALVSYSTTDGTARADGYLETGDYAGAWGSIRFAQGQMSATITIPLHDDRLVEGDETLKLSLRDAVGATLGATAEATVTLRDNERAGQLQFARATALAAESSGSAALEVTRTGGSDGLVTFRVTAIGGTATPGADFEVPSFTYYLDAGATSLTLWVNLTNDGVTEGAETVRLALTDLTGGATPGSPAEIVLTIVDQPLIRFADAELVVSEGAGAAVVTVVRTEPIDTGAQVLYQTADGSATSPSDYTFLWGTLTFEPGQAQAVIAVPVAADGQAEGSESFSLSLSSPSAGVGLGEPSRVTVLLTDGEAPAPSYLRFSTPLYQVSEAGGQAVLAVQRSGSTAREVTVRYTTRDGSAAAGSDYQAVSGTLTWAPGELVRVFSVPVLADGQAEADETVIVSLSEATGGATLEAPSTATLTINDAPPVEPMPGNLGAIASLLTHSIEYYTWLVTGAYWLYLKRLPDAGGLAYWVDQLKYWHMSDEHLEANFLASREYIANHGGTGSVWVVGMYQDLLGRPPDADGLNYWLGRLAAGDAPYGIAYGFAASRERETMRVRGDYLTYLGREPDAGGLDYWVGQFLGGAMNEDLVAGFVGSEEYYGNPYRGQANRRAWVRAAYHDVLQRNVTDSEQEYWLSQMV